MILKINEICSTRFVKTVYLYSVFELKFLYLYLFCGFFLLHVLITLFLAVICNVPCFHISFIDILSRILLYGLD